MDMRTESEWRASRREVCLKAGIVNLNAGTSSPTSRAVLHRVTELAAEQASDPVGFTFRFGPRQLEDVREKVAALADCPAPDLLLLPNATYGINAVAWSLALKSGDEILLSDQEYTHYMPLWQRIADERGARLVKAALPLPSQVPRCSPEQLIEAFERRLTPKTKVLFVSHVMSTTGLVLPVKELCDMARARGILSIIDGAHALGAEPLSLAELRPDYYAANLHKWMMGATGAAFLYVAPEQRGELKPLITNGAYPVTGERLEESVGDGGPAFWTYRHEYLGTRNLIPLLAVPEAINFHAKLGLKSIRERTSKLAEVCREAMAPLGLESVSHVHPRLASCMHAWLCPDGTDPMKLWWWLRDERQHEVQCAKLDDGRAIFRVSTAWFNTSDEINGFASLLRNVDWSLFQRS